MAETPKQASMFMSSNLHMIPYQSYIPYNILSQNLLKNPAINENIISTQPKNSTDSSIATVSQSENKHPHERTIDTVSFAIAAAIFALMERVHYLMQCQNEMIKAGYRSSFPYKGIKDCLLKTIKHEGVLSLWRGSFITVMCIMTTEAMILGFRHLTPNSTISKKLIKLLQPKPEGERPSLEVNYSHPFDYLRVRLANDVKTTRQLQFSLDSSKTSCRGLSDGIGKRKFSGVFDVYKKTLQSEGIVGLFRGFIPACLYFNATHQAIHAFLSHINQVENIKGNFRILPIITYGIVGMNLFTVFYPALTISRRMMMTSCEAVKYKGVVDAFLQIVKHEGVSSLYKGATPFMIYLIAVFATAAVLSELIQKSDSTKITSESIT